ncbi:signal peptidase I [Clostridium sp. YIM B02515]|uniref:Signal peptidase I n=1 Tax=Clostridium rhizosphaerae TaxID=2803861 RepID=A0ABS1TDQ7_9CLOT|nr:signal peptidase I [Clostridium rhizosphaerae]MBL4937502.1 signal peptidase I [Clostridium rhizosphaerae]
MKKIVENIRKVFGNKAVKRTLKYTGNVIIALLIVLVGLSVYGNIQSKGRDWAVPTVGSYRWLTVLSGSMQPTFNPGDLIIEKKVDPSSLKKGDVVTYMFGGNFLSTHRIIEVNKDDKGKYAFKTKGDNNQTADENVIPENMIVGKYSFRIPFVGFVLQKLKGLPGIIAIWLLFFYVAGSEVYRNIKESKKQKTEETVVQ